jgi:hypothetical protein
MMRPVVVPMPQQAHQAPQQQAPQAPAAEMGGTVRLAVSN